MDDFMMDDGPFMGIETFVPLIIGIIFLVIFSVIIISIIQGIRSWSNNNKQPKLNVVAKVVTKRTEHRGSNDSSRTWYYATFEVESGDRMEMDLSGDEYGMLVEGDIGNLTFQGTRYFGFERI